MKSHGCLPTFQPTVLVLVLESASKWCWNTRTPDAGSQSVQGGDLIVGDPQFPGRSRMDGSEQMEHMGVSTMVDGFIMGV